MNADQLFWDCARRVDGIDGVAEATMLGRRCLRIHGDFLAMPVDGQL